MGKLTINGGFSIAILDYQKVIFLLWPPDVIFGGQNRCRECPAVGDLEQFCGILFRRWLMDGCWIVGSVARKLPSANVKHIAIENGLVEMVYFPIEHGGSVHRFL